ncbi:MAG: sterol desaturase family protein [Aquihabitans sp.]
MLDAVADWSWWEVLAVGIVLNVATLISSILLWDRIVRWRGLGDLTRRPTRAEWLLTASTVAVNASALLPGWWLWREGRIELAPPALGRTLIDVVFLVAGVDTVMYFVHRIFHHGLLYRWFHRIHHVPDRRMSPVALFVMHPLEAAGFSFVVLVLMALVPVTLASVVLFFSANLVVGTLAHLPRRAGAPERWWDRWLGGPAPHQAHHEHEPSCFGFFTQVWDRVLGTAR